MLPPSDGNSTYVKLVIRFILRLMWGVCVSVRLIPMKEGLTDERLYMEKHRL